MNNQSLLKTTFLHRITQRLPGLLFHPGVILTIIGIFYLVTIRNGHRWGDDFSMYILHARNIVEGRGYQDTGYIYDPFTAIIGPRSYPPVFPLTLAPLYALFGLNLIPMKVEVIAFFILFLAVFYLAFRKDLSPPIMALALALIGFNPAIWDMKDDITSDFLFLLLAFLTLWTAQKAYSPGLTRRKWVFKAVMVGILSCLSTFTRNIGLVLIPSLFVFDLFHRKRPSLFPWIATAVFALGWWMQSLANLGPNDYFDQLGILPRTLLYNLQNYLDALRSAWSNGYFLLLQSGLFAVVIILTLIGVWLRLRSGITIYEIFAVFYLVLIIRWPANQGMRFLLPVLPLIILYSCLTIQAVAKLENTRLKMVGKAAMGLISLLILASYAGVYTRTGFSAFNSGVETPSAKELFAYIQANTQPGEAFLFNKPRALALFTGRPAAGYSELENELFTLGYANQHAIKYMIVGPGDDYLRLLIKRYPDNFELVFSNPDFKMYRYKGYAP